MQERTKRRILAAVALTLAALAVALLVMPRPDPLVYMPAIIGFLAASWGWTARELENAENMLGHYRAGLIRNEAARAISRQLAKELEEADHNVLACLDVLASLSAHQSPSGRLWFGEPGSGPAYSEDAEKTVARLLAERVEVRS